MYTLFANADILQCNGHPPHDLALSAGQNVHTGPPPTAAASSGATFISLGRTCAGDSRLDEPGAKTLELGVANRPCLF